MKKKIKKVLLLAIILLCIYITKGIYATNGETVTVTNWKSLEDTIENSEKKEIEIQLSDEESNIWTADSKITISSEKKIYLVSNSSITINRANDFFESMIENTGSLNMTTSSGEIVFDGNNIQATGSLITVIGGSLNIQNTTLKKNNKSGNGGAIYASDAQLEIENVKLSENIAYLGGAIYISGESSEAQLNNVEIINNTANAKSGGGVYAFGKLTVSGEKTLISANTAQTCGGGLMIKTVGILNSGTISENKALTECRRRY